MTIFNHPHQSNPTQNVAGQRSKSQCSIVGVKFPDLNNLAKRVSQLGSDPALESIGEFGTVGNYNQDILHLVV